MAEYLVIVESPAKATTIKRILGSKYKIEASMGHIRDLPKSQLGIDVENNFEPKYINIRGKAELIKKLKNEAKNADKVYLATDPDREGEAIAWHLAYLLGIDDNSECRIARISLKHLLCSKVTLNSTNIDPILILCSKKFFIFNFFNLFKNFYFAHIYLCILITFCIIYLCYL